MALNDFRAVFLPYCLDRQPDGRYAVLNRESKPVGFATYDHIDYAKYPVLVRLRITAAVAAALSWEGSRDTQHVYLYNDGTNPIRSKKNMAAYLAKLERLAKMTVRDR